ncbi:MAG: DNA alkylation repair protein [Acidobacteriota bacterium]|nr:DNA alkylation repair protein [Acidobacteriota bacterium]
MKNTFSPPDIARRGVKELRARANPAKAAEVQRYFKDAVRSYGIASPEVREIAAGIYRDVKGDWTVDDAVELCDILFPEPELETKAIAALILARFKSSYGPELFLDVKKWLSRDYLDNWASVDVFCPYVVGELLVRYPKLIRDIKLWALHPNRWVKRASAVSFIRLAKNPEFADVIYEIAVSLFPVEDDLIRKANGWLLREVGKKDMRRLERFLVEKGPSIPRTTLRYAIERFEERKRRALLERTRGEARTR